MRSGDMFGRFSQEGGRSNTRGGSFDRGSRDGNRGDRFGKFSSARSSDRFGKFSSGGSSDRGDRYLSLLKPYKDVGYALLVCIVWLVRKLIRDAIDRGETNPILTF